MADPARSILVVDDEAEIRNLLTDLLKDAGYESRHATTGAEAIEEVGKSMPDLVMMDVKLPDQDGLAVLRQLKREHPDLEVIVMTAFGGSSSAIKAMEHGAYDYVTKPFEMDDLLATLKRVFEHADMSNEVSALRLELGKSAADRERIVGSSKPMLEVFKLIGKVAGSDATVLITGESGTGKELVAEALHRASKRNPHPLVKVSCAALPETLLETELFGHEKGSFTGAMTMRKGRFETANKGTIFLDEIGEMTPATQTKLLRILQEREFERIGAQRADQDRHPRDHRHEPRPRRGGRRGPLPRGPLLPAQRDPHPHAAAARPQGGHPAAGRALPREVPIRAGAPSRPRITEEALARLVDYDWPGNVRELENAIERAVVLARGNPITVEHLPFDGHRESEVSPKGMAARRTKLDKETAELDDRRQALEEDEADVAAVDRRERQWSGHAEGPSRGSRAPAHQGGARARRRQPHEGGRGARNLSAPAVRQDQGIRPRGVAGR